MNARCINSKQQTGREQVGGFGFSNSFFGFSMIKEEDKDGMSGLQNGVPQVQRDSDDRR
jgi:hypothetical protein